MMPVNVVMGCHRCRWLAGLFLAVTLAAVCRGADTFTSAYISEFMAANQDGLRDEDGEPSGWIEICNGGAATLDLAGWSLTDSKTNLTRWRFPEVSLLPNGYLVVFASAKNRRKNPGYLHTNFRLDGGGGYLALADRATNVVSQFAPGYPPQSNHVSYGSVRGEPAIRGYFSRPTPRKPNTASGPGFAPEVNFSRLGGTFTTPFGLQLSSRQTDAVIRYTLDGKLPTRDSPAYRAALSITNTAQVRARAFQEGLLPGPPRGEVYLWLRPDALQFSSRLPVLILDTLGQDRSVAARSSLVHLSVYEPGDGRASLTNRPTFTTRAGFHVRGSSSSGLPQPGLAVQFLDEFDQEQHRAFLGLPAESDWVLYAPNGYEPVMIHNPFIHELSREMGRYSARTRFVEAFLVRNSGGVAAADYHGLYVLEERIKIGKNRVDIDRLGPTDLKPPEVTGGYLLKIDRLGQGEGGFSAAGVSMAYVDPKEALISLPQRAAQRQYLEAFFRDFDHALSGPNWKDPVLGYPAFIDVDSWIDYHVLEVLSGHVDSLVLSTYFHKPRNGKLVFGPHWDFDRALGSTDGRDDNPRRWNTGRFFDAPWWSTLLSDPDFWQRWVDRWQALRTAQFSMTNLCRLIDGFSDEVREVQPRQAERWGLHPRGGSYESEITLMKSWLSNRVEFIDQQLVRPPGLSRRTGRNGSGFLVSLTGPTNATVYYTVDGSDPRLSGGGLSSRAAAYAGPIQVNAGARVRVVARSRNPKQRQTGGAESSTWSGPVSEK